MNQMRRMRPGCDSKVQQRNQNRHHLGMHSVQSHEEADAYLCGQIEHFECAEVEVSLTKDL